MDSDQSYPKHHEVHAELPLDHAGLAWRILLENPAGMVKSAFPRYLVNYVDAMEMEMPYWMMSYAELVDLFIDRNDRNASMQMSYMREVIQQLKRKEAFKIGLAAVSVDTPIYFPLVEMYMMFKAANEEKKDFGKVQGALYGQFDEFLIRMQSRFNDVRYDFLLKPKKRNNSDSMADLLRQFVGLGDDMKSNITVVDLSSVPTDVRPAVSAQVGRLVYEFNYWNPKRREFPITLICEEAHAVYS